jgi:uncharacterized membrane protein
MNVVLRAVITLLCGVGFYASLFMLAKTRRDERGELTEPSVVQSPRARLYGGVPNSLIGAAYYPALAIASWFDPPQPLAIAICAAAFFAAATSLALAYSLIFVTRRPCPYCWTAHAINWSLLILVPWLFKTNVLSNGR